MTTEAGPKRRWMRPGCGSVRRSAGAHLAWTGVLLGAAMLGAEALGLPPGFAVGTLGIYALLTTYVALRVEEHAPHVRFGAANRLTLLRGALACLLGGLVVVAPEAEPRILWTAAAAGFLSLALDGIDGLIARRRGEASRFGAAFDLETDALLILLLSVLMYRLDRAGVWVLAVGMLRYVFVLAGRIAPALARPLPESRRRKTVCAVQVAVLVACIPPVLPPEAASAALAAALAILAASFAVDVAWLLRRNEAAGQNAPWRRQILPPGS